MGHWADVLLAFLALQHTQIPTLCMMVAVMWLCPLVMPVFSFSSIGLRELEPATKVTLYAILSGLWPILDIIRDAWDGNFKWFAAKVGGLWNLNRETLVLDFAPYVPECR